MSGRELLVGSVGVLVGVGIAIAGNAIAGGALAEDADNAENATRVVMVTSFTPDEPWTEEYARAGVRELSADYARDNIDGFQGKLFVGDFTRGEFGGIYRFASEEARMVFLAKHPPAENRTVKTYRVLGEWRAEAHDGQ